MPKDRPSTPAQRPGRIGMAAATALVVALSGGVVATATGTAAAVGAVDPIADRADQADFNNDGYADTAVSSSGAHVAGQAQAGQVTALYGQPGGPRSATFSQNSAGVPGAAEKDDLFGADSAHGDFDGDGYDDLAVGTVREDVGGDVDGGSVTVLWGSANGLSTGTTVKDPRPTKHDAFGGTLEAGDFDGDGRDDLVVGARSGAATLDVFSAGISRTGAVGRHYTVVPPVMNEPGAGPLNLYSGDVDADGREDLIVDGFDKSDTYNANFWLPGSAGGVTASGAQRLPGGYITDVGDTDSDGYGDIVIGMLWDEGIAGAREGGAVHVVRGAASGPDGGTDTFSQDTAGVPGGGEKNDVFGAEIELGDVNGDGRLDLVVGAPGENLDGVVDAGAVTVLYGAADGSGITGEGARFLEQNTPGVPNSSETEDFFGSDVHLDDLNGDGRDDVVIGAYGENGGNGAVHVLDSGADGSLTSPGGIYVSDVGISTAGTPHLGSNITD
ncbi:FG-GAP repeat protein [Streptomyces luteolus]